MERFARIRSANRALPAAASQMAGSEQRESDASQLRARLAELAGMEAPAAELAKVLKGELREIDASLETMESDLYRRFDVLDFVSLRASIPRSVERNRREVVALVEALLSEKKHLLERLPRVEYLITILSTEETDGRRNIVHDPTTLTPMIDAFSEEVLDTAEADAVAMELYQAATLDSDSENFDEILRSLRARKKRIGIGCLAPSVLRAVVTYNARMFNSVESMQEAARASDAVVDDELLALTELDDDEDVFGDLDLDAEMPSDELSGTSANDGSQSDSSPASSAPTLAALLGNESAPVDSENSTEETEEEQGDAASVNPVDELAASAASQLNPPKDATEESREGDRGNDREGAREEPVVEVERVGVYQSKALGSVMRALRARLEGERVGRRGSAERVAIVLDQASLEEIEIEAICAESPDREQNLIARTAVLGLVLRDLGPIEEEVKKLGVDREQMTDEWVRVLNEELGQAVSSKLGDSNAYEAATLLSRIKSKHLAKPMNALKALERKESEALLEMSGLENPSGNSRSAGGARGRKGKNSSRSSGQAETTPMGGRSTAGISLGENRLKIFAAAALVMIALSLAAMNWVDVAPSDIRILRGSLLSDNSSYLKSAYRNDSGRGGLLIGRVDADFKSLSLERRIEEAGQMAENFRREGVVEAMVYDDRGLMLVHYADGQIRRPRVKVIPTQRGSTGRRGLMGVSLIEEDSEDEDDWGESSWDDSDDGDEEEE